MNCSDVITGYLGAAGIKHIFSYPGDPSVELFWKRHDATGSNSFSPGAKAPPGLWPRRLRPDHGIARSLSVDARTGVVQSGQRGCVR